MARSTMNGLCPRVRSRAESRRANPTISGNHGRVGVCIGTVGEIATKRTGHCNNRNLFVAPKKRADVELHRVPEGGPCPFGGHQSISGGFLMKFQRKKVAVAVAMLAGGAFSALVVAPAGAQTAARRRSASRSRVPTFGASTRKRRARSRSSPPEQMIQSGLHERVPGAARPHRQTATGTLSQGFQPGICRRRERRRAARPDRSARRWS